MNTLNNGTSDTVPTITSSFTLGDTFELIKEIPTNSTQLILTDPPYNCTSNNWDKDQIDLPTFFDESFRILKDDGVLAVFCDAKFMFELHRHAPADTFRYMWVWQKEQAGNFMLAKKQPMRYTEYVLIFSKNPNPTYYPQMVKGKEYTRTCKVTTGDNFGGKELEGYTRTSSQRYPSNILQFNRERGLHPTQKPVPLLEQLIQTYTKEGELVVDWFAGSGSTLVASKNLNRPYTGFELCEEYYGIGCIRLSQVQ